MGLWGFGWNKEGAGPRREAPQGFGVMEFSDFGWNKEGAGNGRRLCSGVERTTSTYAFANPQNPEAPQRDAREDR